MREALIQKELKHQFICRIIDIFNYDNELKIILEYAKGGSLRDLLNDK